VVDGGVVGPARTLGSAPQRARAALADPAGGYRHVVAVDAGSPARGGEPLAGAGRDRPTGVPWVPGPGSADPGRYQYLAVHGLHRAAAVRRSTDDPPLPV